MASCNRGPRPREFRDVDREFAGEVLHHRVLSSGADRTNANITGSRCSPTAESKRCICTMSNSNLRAHVNTRPPPSSNIEARPCHKRGWKVQGQVAGEWRDRLGRHRRARPTENANTNAITASGSALAADFSRNSSTLSSSCAGSEVSFEGLVDELRERLPRASLLDGFVAARHQNGHQACPGIQAMVAGRMERQGDGSGICGGSARRTAPSTETSTARGTSGSTGGPEQQRGEDTSGLMPPGCLRLRHPMTGPMTAHTTSQPLMRQTSRGPNNAARIGPQPSLVLPPGGTLFSDGSAYRLVTTEAADVVDVSPSAAMVAAAKAQERALPLLQVCAVKVAELTSS